MNVEGLTALADELAAMSDETVAATEEYRRAIDAQARRLARLTARVNGARQILADPNLRQYRRTYVGNTLENLRALLDEDVA